MLDLITTILALMFIVGSLLVITMLVVGAYAVVQNTQFYARWQRKRRERMAEKFMESLKK
jgi:Flp pilus assembly protein TadB